MESDNEDHISIVSDQATEMERFSPFRSKADIHDDKRFLEGIYPHLNGTKNYTGSVRGLLHKFMLGLINDAGILSTDNHEMVNLPIELYKGVTRWFEERGFILVGYPLEFNGNSFNGMNISTSVALLRHFHERPVHIVELAEIPSDIHVNEDGTRYRILFQGLGQKIRAHLLNQCKEVGLLSINRKQIPHEMDRVGVHYTQRAQLTQYRIQSLT